MFVIKDQRKLSKVYMDLDKLVCVYVDYVFGYMR